MRIEPPPSLPCATGQSPAAVAAAAPPLEPPGVRVRVPGIPAGAVQLRLGLRDRAELRRVRLAEHDEPGLADAPHDRGVEVGHVVRICLRRVRRPQPGRLVQVLDRDRHAVERRVGRRRLGRARGRERTLGVDGDERVQLRVEPLDPLEIELRRARRARPSRARTCAASSSARREGELVAHGRRPKRICIKPPPRRLAAARARAPGRRAASRRAPLYGSSCAASSGERSSEIRPSRISTTRSRRDVLRPREHGAAVADREAVEDVLLDVAGDLVDLPDLVALGVDDAPAALDHAPGDEVGHRAQTALPADVPDRALRADRMRVRERPQDATRPGMPSSSRRARQRRAMSGGGAVAERVRDAEAEAELPGRAAAG